MPRRLASLPLLARLAFVGSVVSAWLPAVGQITLNADFDHGSLDEKNSSIDDRVITLVGRDHFNADACFNADAWKWLHFAAFKGDLRAVNGLGSFERSNSGVPESSTRILVAVGMPHAPGGRQYV